MIAKGEAVKSLGVGKTALCSWVEQLNQERHTECLDSDAGVAANSRVGRAGAGAEL